MTDQELNRRDFARHLTSGIVAASAVAVATASGAVGPVDSRGAPTATSKGNAVADQNEESRAAETAPQPPEISETAWTLGLILKRYTDERLDEAAIQGIAGDIQSDIARSRALSSFPLDNADEPGYVFQPWRGNE